MLTLEQQQQRIEEMAREMEMMRAQIKQLQDERDRAQSVQGNAVDPSVSVGDSQIQKSLTFKDQLTTLPQEFDEKVMIHVKGQLSFDKSVHLTKNSGTRTQLARAVPYSTDRKIHLNTPLFKSGKANDTIPVQLGQESTFSEALSYINKVKNAYSDQPMVYQQFLISLLDYGHEKITNSDLRTNVSQLLYKHPPNNVELDSILPLAHPASSLNGKAIDAITVQLEQERRTSAAIAYCNEVKYAYSDQPLVYKQFLIYLLEYQRRKLSESDLEMNVTQLFQKHPQSKVQLAEFSLQSHEVDSQDADLTMNSNAPKTPVEITSDQVIEDEEDFVVIEHSDVNTSVPTTTQVPIETKFPTDQNV